MLGDAGKLIAHLARKSADNHGDIVPIVNVWTGEEIARVRTSTQEDALEALEHARRVQMNWKRTTIQHRTSLLRRGFVQVQNHKEQIAGLLAPLDGRSDEENSSVYCDTLMALDGVAHLLPQALSRGGASGPFPLVSRTRVDQVPMGVIGMFCTQDFSFSYLTDVLPALASGNAVLQFITPQMACGCYAARDMLESVGLPVGLWQIVISTNRRLGKSLSTHCDAVAFFGNSDSGFDVARDLQDYFIPFRSFLGAKNAAIIMNDADIDLAVRRLIWSAFCFAGQSITAFERIFVHEDVYEEFLEKSKQFIDNRIAIGPGPHPGRLGMGSLNTTQRLECCVAQVANAVSLGAEVFCGGNHRPDLGPLVFEPTIMVDVPPEADLNREEIYGPIVQVDTFVDFRDACAALEEQVYSHTLSIFTKDMVKATRIAPDLPAGTVAINDIAYMLWVDWAIPLVGFHESGNGSRHGIDAIRQYTRVQAMSEAVAGTGLVSESPVNSFSEKFRRAFITGRFWVHHLYATLPRLHLGIPILRSIFNRW